MTGFTIRISNIPSSATDGLLLQVLNGLPCDTDLDEQRQNVLGWSLTPSAISADAKISNIATVTFKSVPQEFKFASLSKATSVFGGAAPAIVDSHFYGLTPLSNPPKPVVDIISVTGLAGHAFGSWKSRGGYKMWLRDFLPRHVPDARILTYGYDSTLFENTSNASIREFSQNFLEALKTARVSDEEKYRPIIFICHSLGGIIVKYALLAAQDGGVENELIFSSCHALLLFGVPHKGLNVASLRSMVKGQPNSQLINDLDESSSFLDLLDRFWKSSVPQSIRVVSVYETKATPTVKETLTGLKRTGPEVLMVTRDSAICATPEGETSDCFSIDANHSDIVKFGDSSCQEYLNIASKIIALVKDAHDTRLYLPFRGPGREKTRGKILKWLSRIEYTKHHQNAKEGLLENTGQWLLKRKEFCEWRSSKVSGILWLHGIPGAGKTKLMCMVIDALQFQRRDRESHRKQEPVVYFYCNKTEPLRQDPTTIMQAIAKQLSLVGPGLPKPVVAEYDKRVGDSASGSLSFEESHELVLSLLAMYPQTAIIIDALDEADPKERWRLLKALKAILQSSTNLVKIFVSSRDDIDIKLKLNDVPNIYIQAWDNDDDIQRFVNRELAQSIENGLLLCGEVTDKLRGEIVSAIVAKAKGMFQWAHLQILYICDMNSEDDIKANLGRLPETLEGAYSKVYGAILSEKEHAKRIAQKALLWIICSRRQLTRKGWVEASYWPDEAPNNGFDILLKLCRNLVTWDSHSQVVRFAHLSVQEYLTSKFTSIDANSMAARDCLSFLSLKYWLADGNPCLLEPEGSFGRYATYHWQDHVKSSYDGKGPMGRDMLELLQSFLGKTAEPSQAYCSWLQKVTPRTEYPHPDGIYYHLQSTPPNPLFAASCFGLERVLQEQWEHGSFNINCKNEFGETLLYVASMQGNEQVVDFLLEKGAAVNSGDGFHGSSPLEVAIRKDRERTVVQLLEKGAGRYTNVLELAAYCGGRKTMKALLDRDLDIKITDAMVVAVARGMCRDCEWKMKVLLDRDPDFKITDAVVTAVAAVGDKLGSMAVMKVLLDRNPDIRITSSIMVAVARNRGAHSEELMKILLDRDPDIGITDAVLEAAAGNSGGGSLGMMEMLLDRNSNIRITDTVLAAAAGNPGDYSLKVMEMLLDRNPVIEITDAVLAAAAMGNSWHSKEVMNLLLKRDPDIKITDAVLVAAAGSQGYQSLEVMEMLLDRDPDIRITDAVLVAAAENTGDYTSQFVEMMTGVRITNAVVGVAVGNTRNYILHMKEMLLDSDPDINAVQIAAEGNKGGSMGNEIGKEMTKLLLDRYRDIEVTEAVVVAAASNRWSGKGVMEVLLDRHPDTKITDAVLVAAAGNEANGKEMVKILLDKDPDIKITNAVLVAAAGNMQEGKEMVEMLLDRDPDIKITNAVLMAAKGNERSGKEVVGILNRYRISDSNTGGQRTKWLRRGRWWW